MATIDPAAIPALKHREVERALRAEIEAGRWPAADRLPGEHELARRFDVAYMTVRRAVAQLVDDGILRRVRGKGTFIVAQDLTVPLPRTTHPMALFFPSDWQRSDPYYFPELLDAFQQRMSETGERVAIYDYKAVETPGLLEPGSAVACLLLNDEHLQLVESLRDGGFRVLALNHYTGRRSIPCVRIDDAEGIGQAVAHLAERGHSRIGFLRGKPGNLDAADRLRGFRAAARRFELREISAMITGDGFSEAAGYAAACELLAASEPPTALVCASDLAAIGAIKAARDMGLRVPEDVSIIGFGDFSVAPYLNPGLTTIRQSRLDLGRTAAESLIRLANDDDATGAVLSADLIVRESTTYPAPSAPVRASKDAVIQKGRSHVALR